MDKLQWFKFTPSDWMMGKIQRCPEITQARFMRLCCLYWNKEANLLTEDAIIEIDQEHYDILITKKIITSDGAHVFIKFLDEQLVDITETSKGKSKAAKARWDKYKKDKIQNADAMHVHTDAVQNDAEKRREEKEEIREDKSIKNDFDFSTLKNTEWANQFCKAKGILPNKFNLIFDSFLSDLILKGQHLEYKDKEKEFKNHFVNWYRRNPPQVTQSTVKRNNVVGFNKE
jgi:hypothetical protein